MKVKTLSALAGLGGALIMSSSAQAAFVGLELVNVTNWMSTTSAANIQADFNANGAGFEVYRVFAMFDGLGGDNRVNALSGLVGNPWSFNLSSGSVYNLVDGTGGSTSPFTFYNNPGPNATVANAPIGWDTWATIGTQFGANPQSYAPGSHDPGQLNNFSGNYSANAAALFITPDDAQGNAIALNTTSAAGQGHTGNGVLIMQITVAAGSLFSGQVNVNVGAAGLAPQDILGLTYSNIPAPGALALLGLAGLVSRRRRA